MPCEGERKRFILGGSEGVREGRTRDVELADGADYVLAIGRMGQREGGDGTIAAETRGGSEKEKRVGCT